MKKLFFYLTIIISVVLILATLLSLFSGTNTWWLRVLNYPREHFLILAIVCLLIFPFFKNDEDEWHFASISLMLGLATSLIIQCYYVFPYTFIADKTVPSAEDDETIDVNTAGILIANVTMSNRHAEEFLTIIDNADPEMVLAMETNQWWIDQLSPLLKEYPYTMLYPLDNTYGMALYSKYPLIESEIKFLHYPDVPSFHTQVRLPSGKSFMFHGVHPTPPYPLEKYPDNVGEKDIALLKVGEMAAANPLPDVVAGDYNDVFWGHAEHLFQKQGRLNNVRTGRWIYNTFNARSWFIFWPLDHYFVTNEFAILQLERLEDFHSTHYPLFAKFVLRD